MPKILLVANPGDHDELAAALRGGDDDELATADLLREVGDDATLARFVELRPEVVLVAATLEDGDARALIAAMRDAVLPAQPFVVMIGDTDGPMRTALDAIGAGIDRFVTRPLSAKALRFAVASGLARASVEPLPVVPRAAPLPTPPPPAPVSPPAEPPPAAEVATVADAGAVTVSEPVPVSGPISLGSTELRARWAALADQLGGDDEDDDAQPVGDGDVIDEDLLDEELAGEDGDDDGDGPDRIVVALEDPPMRAPASWPPPVHASPPPPPRPHPQPPPPRPPSPALVEPPSPALAEPPSPALAEPPVVTGPITDVMPAVDVAALDVALEAGPSPLEMGLAPVARAIEDSVLVVEPHFDAPAPEPESAPAAATEPEPAATAEVSGEREPPSLEVASPPTEPPRMERGPYREPEPPPLPPPPPEAWRPGSTEVPGPEPADAPAPLPVREPTLVLTERSLPEEPTGEHGPIGWRIAAPGPLVDDLVDDDPLDDEPGGALDDDLSVDLPGEPTRARELPVTPPPPQPPVGGDFGRELRKKMSQMAERLFRGADLPAAPVAIGPAHDHHTEIDLGGLVDDDDDVDLAAATFVGPEGRLTDPRGGDEREPRDPRGAEGGELQRGIADAPALIARMFAADFTGRVVFRHRDAEKVVHFEGGRPVFASSNLVRDRMGELLVREGKITREQHDRCQDLVRDTGRRMGEILVDRGYLKRRELLPAVRRHVEDILYSLFAWDTGEYRIVAGDGATAERIRLSRHPAAMVLEGVRRKLDRATLERLVGPPTTLIETTDRDKLAATIGVADLAAEERAALAALDGSTDLAAVARAAALSLANLYPLVWSLQLLGLATARRRPGDEEGDAPALVGESDLAIDRARVRARAALVADADYFALLGVRRDATGFEIKRAYEAARRDFAAESFPGELRRELEAELDEIAVVLDEAYRVLRDDTLRAAYRAHLREPGEAA